MRLFYYVYVVKSSGIYIQKRAFFYSSLHSYVQEKRLEYAARLLEENDISISEAAIKSGYTNMSHFSKSFFKKYGVLPKDY